MPINRGLEPTRWNHQCAVGFSQRSVSIEMLQNLYYRDEENDDPENFQVTRNNVHSEISIINFGLTFRLIPRSKSQDNGISQR